MKVKIIAFGQIAEITTKEFSIECKDVDELKEILLRLFPLLAAKKYAIAINKKLTNENHLFAENDTAALMPPYSGG